LILSSINTALNWSWAVALVGPRQTGKTTLARQFVSPDSLNYFVLEELTSLSQLEEPMTALRDLRGLVVIDEIQRRPDLLPILRVLCDRDQLPAHFLILGSASPDLVRASSESLAGQVETISISGFSLAEVGVEALA
jgi:predicted AAA+ superfamily ATPase